MLKDRECALTHVCVRVPSGPRLAQPWSRRHKAYLSSNTVDLLMMLNVSCHFKSSRNSRQVSFGVAGEFVHRSFDSFRPQKGKSGFDSRAVAEWGSCHVASSTWLESAP